MELVKTCLPVELKKLLVLLKMAVTKGSSGKRMRVPFHSKLEGPQQIQLRKNFKMEGFHMVRDLVS